MSGTVFRMRLRRSWRAWRKLSADERRLIFTALRLWPVCRLTLRRRGAQAAADRLLRPSSSPRPLPEAKGMAKAVARLVDRLGRQLPGESTCLERSLLTASLLRRRGVDAEVQIGVRQAEGGIDFHAWVTVENEIVSDGQEQVAEYQPLALSGLPTGS
jgi:hypothetical protein